MEPCEWIKDWLVVPKEEIIIESEFENEFIQKCIQIELKKAIPDKQFMKDIHRIKIGYYKISTRCRDKLLELGYKI